MIVIFLYTFIDQPVFHLCFFRPSANVGSSLDQGKGKGKGKNKGKEKAKGAGQKGPILNGINFACFHTFGRNL